MQKRTFKRGTLSTSAILTLVLCYLKLVCLLMLKSGLNTDFCPSELHTSLCCCSPGRLKMEGTGPGWLVPSSHKDHQMLPALTSDASKEFYSLALWLPRTLCGRPAGTARGHRSDAEEETPGPSSGEGRAAGRLRAGSSPSSAAAAGMLRSAASGGQRPLQLGGSASGVQGLRQPAGTPGPRSPKHRRPGAFISHPVLFPQIHRLRPLSPSSSPASPRVTTDRSPLSLSLSLSFSLVSSSPRGGNSTAGPLILHFTARETPPPERLKQSGEQPLSTLFPSLPAPSNGAG